MILKVCRNKKTETNKEGCIQVVTEYYTSDTFRQIGEVVELDNNRSVIIGNFGGLDEISEQVIDYETVYAYIMNNEGKTIERLI